MLQIGRKKLLSKDHDNIGLLTHKNHVLGFLIKYLPLRGMIPKQILIFQLGNKHSFKMSSFS